MTMFEEGADDAFDQTHHTDKGRRGDGDGCGAALVCVTC